jgi:excisionase family DNA binding protein
MHPAQHGQFRQMEVRLLTIPEVCQRLGCGRSRFYEKILGKGLIPVRRLGSSTRIRSDDLEAYIASLPATSTRVAEVAK